MANVFGMFYGERLGGEDEPYIAERGIFLSLEEYLPYRQKGWSSTKQIDDAVDEAFKKQKESK